MPFFFSSTRKKSMQLIHTATDVAKLADPALRNLIEATIAALSEDEPFDAAVLGYFLDKKDTHFNYYHLV